MKHNHFLESILKYLFTNKKDNKSENGRGLIFENNGRSGYTIYTDGNKTTRFYTEVGDGDCIFYMVIPSKEQWEKETGYAVAERDEILTFIAQESMKKQANLFGAYYKIHDRHIVFYQK